MQITYLVGNGFDLSLGIQTSYSAFYKYYLQQGNNKEHIKALKENIKKDIEDKKENWSDFETGMGNYTKNFTIETVNDFFECYDDAQSNMINYLKSQESMFDFDAIPNEVIEECQSGLYKFYQELNPAEIRLFDGIYHDNRLSDSKVSFISFNYTSALDKCIEKLPTALASWTASNGRRTLNINKKVIHAHGTTFKYPVIGVNDESQIGNKDLLQIPRFKETMIKPVSVSATGEFWHEEANNYINSSNIICILGMSLGDTDAQWWKKLSSWLYNNKNRRLVIYWHTNNILDTLSIRKRLAEMDKVKEKFLSFSDLDDKQKNSIIDRIHIVINTEKVLKLKVEMKTEAIEKELMKI